jgi:CRP-like cAMP-binding protein
MPFIAWIAPMLFQMEFQKDSYIFMEGEHVNYTYFLLKGESGFVLPRFNNTVYILICQGDYFGTLDLIPESSKIKVGSDVKTWELKRQFTV